VTSKAIEPAPPYMSRIDVVSLAVADESTCSCGQALDCCHAAHCPRCGITLNAA
jgi:hypothetical protein